MRCRNVRERLDENLAAVQALDPLHALALGLVYDFLVELVQRFDVVGREGYRDEDKVRLASAHVVGYGVARLRTEPGGRADLRLPDEAVRVAV